MAHDRHSGIHDAFDLRDDTPAAFQLDGVNVGLFIKPARIEDGILHGYLVGEKRHIADNEGVGRASPHDFRMLHHLVHGHRNCPGVAVDDHAGAVAHQYHIDAGLFHEAGHGEVIGGEVGDFFTLLFHFVEI